MPGTHDPGQFQADDPRQRSADHAQWIATLYAELRALAQSELNAERKGHTLNATALVNEVYLKLSRSADSVGPGPAAGPGSARPLDRAEFFGLAAQAMRRILVDHARGRKRQKRGGGIGVQGSEALRGAADPGDAAMLDPVELDEALIRLAIEHAEAARVVELRFFAGLHEKTIAEIMNINERTVRRHWTFAKAWLARDLNPDEGPPRPPLGMLGE